MMGWGIAIVLLIERGVPWWVAVAAFVGGQFAEVFGRAVADGIKRGRAESQAQDERYAEARGRFEAHRDKVDARLS